MSRAALPYHRESSRGKAPFLATSQQIAQRAAKSAAGDVDERLSLELVAFGERRGDVVDRRGRVNGELEELHTMPEVDEGH